MLGVLDAQDCLRLRTGAERSEDGVGVDHLQRIDVRRADEDGRIWWDRCRYPEATRLLDDRLFA